MNKSFEFNFTVTMDLPSEAHAIAMRNRILNTVLQSHGKEEGFCELFTSEPYVYDPNDPQPDLSAEEALKQ